jgi:lysophospholipase L1-like esterase
VATEENVTLVDVFEILSDYARAHSYQEILLDGVHPNDLAHRLIANALLEQITRLER